MCSFTRNDKLCRIGSYLALQRPLQLDDKLLQRQGARQLLSRDNNNNFSCFSNFELLTLLKMSNKETRVYVGNLPPDIRSKDIEDLFYKYGKVSELKSNF